MPKPPTSNAPDAITASEVGDENASGLVLPAAICVTVVTFLYMAFAISFDAKRRIVMSLLLLPDQVVLSWVDGEWSRFGVVDRLPVAIAAAAILVVAFLAGRITLDVLRVDVRLTRLETALFSLGIGLNFVSVFTLAIGLVGLLQTLIVFVVAAIAVVVVCGARWRRDCIAKLTGVSGDSHSRSHEVGRDVISNKVIITLAVPFVIAIVAGGMLPPWHFDVREYHSQVPKEWYQQGAVTFMPHNIYGNMPLGAEMHAIVGMNFMSGKDCWWWGALVGKTIIATYAPLTALALFAFGCRFVTRFAGAVAAFVFISTPWMTHVSGSGLIDGASAYYLFATFYALMIWHERKESDSSNEAFGLVAIAGLLAGAAVACKYPAMLFVVIPGVIAVALLPLGQIHIRQAIVFGLAVTVACGLWFGKNLVMAENPTYPLLYSVFGGKSRTAEKDEQWTTAHGPPRDAAGKSYTLQHTRQSASLLLWRSEFASLIMLPLAIFGLFAKRHSKLLLVLGIVVGFNVVAWWMLTHRIDRFLVPILPIVALCAGLGADLYSHSMWRRTMLGILCAGFIYHIAFCTSPLPGDNRFLTSYEVLRRDEPSDGPLSAERIHRTHKFLNQAVSEGFQVMCVGEAQVFDLEMPVLYNTCFDDCVFESMMKGKSTTDRAQALRDNRVSHVLVLWYEIDRYRSPGNYGFSDYVTRELVHREFVAEGLFREIPLGLDPNNSQLFEVVGWQSWDGNHPKEDANP